MSNTLPSVEEHWTRAGVLKRIDAALVEAGYHPEEISPEILAGFEHLHTGGLETTKEQARNLGLNESTRVLDIGCGTGGPARYIASTYGCTVDGIDLTKELIEAGRILTERCDLSGHVRLRQGDALDLPYPDQTFDVVWCQNVAMNIFDKTSFLSGINRVLKPGGVFTCAEFSTGPGGEIIYPVPWAYNSSISFLEDEDAMFAGYEAAGLRILEKRDLSEQIVAAGRQIAKNPPSKLANHLIFGEDTAERSKNSQRNLAENRIKYWLVNAKRPD